MPEPIPSIPRGRFHFRLRTLFIAISVIAFLCGVGRYFPWFACGMLLFVGTPLIWFWCVMQSSPHFARQRHSSRRKLRARGFRYAFWVTFPFVATSSLVTYWHTYYAPLFDSSRYIGWPFSFPLAKYNNGRLSVAEVIAIDVIVYVVISLVIAFAMEDGPRVFRMRIIKFLRGRV